MNSIIDTIPQALKAETLASLREVYSRFATPEVIALQEQFSFYETLMREELTEYLDRHDLVTEIDVLMEEKRIEQRIGDEFPDAKRLIETFRDMALQKRRGEYDVKQDFLAKQGTAAQFDALREALGANPRPWWHAAMIT